MLNNNHAYRDSVGVYAWFSSSFFLVCFYITGTMIATQLEISFRADFLARRDLKEARTRENAATNLLKRQNDKMQEFVLEKQRFFSSAYHDIQQPLAVIGLYIRSARQKLKNQDLSIDEDLSLVESNAADMVNLFRGVHDYSELGSYEVQLQAVSLADLIFEIIKQYQKLAEEKNLVLKIATRNKTSRPIQTDRALLKRLLSNLISNAIKYTHQGGVVVGWVTLPNMLRIDVWDTGIGIAKHQREKIFAEYYQVNNPGRDRSRG